MTRFEGRTALVTGGANGIGRASAIAFAEQGARVGILDIEEGPLAETAEAIRAKGGRVVTVVTDMRDRAAVKAAIGQVEAELGRSTSSSTTWVRPRARMPRNSSIPCPRPGTSWWI